MTPIWNVLKTKLTFFANLLVIQRIGDILKSTLYSEKLVRWPFELPHAAFCNGGEWGKIVKRANFRDCP